MAMSSAISPEQQNALQSFPQWKTQTASGKPLARPLTAPHSQLLQASRQTISTEIRQHQEGTARARQLVQDLAAALAKLEFGPHEDVARQGTVRAVQEIQQELQDLAADTTTPSLLQKQEALLAGVLGANVQ